MESLQNCNKCKSKAKLAILIPSLFILVFSSCLTNKNLTYLQGDLSQAKEFQSSTAEYKIKEKDELYIQISSLDEASASIFSSLGNQQYVNLGVIQPYGASMVSYTVEKDGCITLPVIGKLIVKDKTLEEVREAITNNVSNILSQPTVSVKLVNRYVTVLGEVNRPGMYHYFKDEVSIYEAIGLAGDITNWGNRNEVIILRNKNGKNLQIVLDLNNRAMLSSENLYVSPNDIIYVKPLKKKFWGLQEFPYDVLLSAITAAILLYSVVK